MALAESKGLILFTKNHRENDMLVKIFTESAGKQMFYAKGIQRKNHPLKAAVQPFTQAVYIGTFNSENLSFLNSAKDIQPFLNIQQDIFLAGYATYLLNLADAAIEDRVYDPNLYHFLAQSLLFIDQGYDAEIITNIFEIQVLQRFGVLFDWQHCAICGETHGKYVYSSKYHGLLCEKHQYLDPRHYPADYKMIQLVRIFSQIRYEQINQLDLKPETKQRLRQFIDFLYDEYVGIHLKSKKFIDQMKNWQDILIKPETNSATESNE